MQILHKINKVLYNIVKYLIMILLAVMSVLVFAQVAFRYLLHSPLAWSEELTTYMFSWLAYFGAAVVLYHNDHVSITSVVDMLKNETVKKAIAVVRQIIILVFFVVAGYLSYKMAFQVIGVDQRLTNITSLKVGYIFMQVPVSATIMGLFTIEKIWNIIKNNGKESLI